MSHREGNGGCPKAEAFGRMIDHGECCPRVGGGSPLAPDTPCETCRALGEAYHRATCNCPAEGRDEG